MTLPHKAVYVLYPRGVRTGGPEALYQLGSQLMKLGVPVFMVPLPKTKHQAPVADYRAYGVPESSDVDDKPENAVVIPESWYFASKDVRRAQRFIWWLSIDKAPMFQAAPLSPVGSTWANASTQAGGILRHGLNRTRYALMSRARLHHLTQSNYAWSYLYGRATGPRSMVSDFTVYQDKGHLLPVAARNKRISYNFAKGGHLVEEVIAKNNLGCEWVPIRGMSKAEVEATLRSSTIYLDLGVQPGKDRLPREAAMFGAISVIRREGAGAFYLDAPLPPDHKIGDAGSGAQGLIDSTIAVLQNVLQDPQAHFDRQAPYRNAIQQEFERFQLQVRRVFVDGVEGIDWEPEL